MDHHATPRKRQPRKYLGVRFECCRVYTRVYRRPGQMYYDVRCPKCLRNTRVRVAADGTSQRFFTAR